MVTDWAYLKASAATLALAKPIAWILTDCDGCLTDGGVYFGAEGEVLKRFSIVDGMGVARLRQLGVNVGIVTGETSPSVQRRAEKLRLEEVHLGISDKAACVAAFSERHGLVPAQLAYFGDDVNDLPVLPYVGLFGAPANAVPDVLAKAHWVTARPGGFGAFRDFAELVLRARS